MAIESAQVLNATDPGQAVELCIDQIYAGLAHTRPKEARVWFINKDWIYMAQPGNFYDAESLRDHFGATFAKRWGPPGKPEGPAKWMEEGPRVLEMAFYIGVLTSFHAVAQRKKETPLLSLEIDIKNFKYGVDQVTTVCQAKLDQFNKLKAASQEILLAWCGG